MLCDECGVNNATVEFVSIINGKKIERHLCPACAHKLGADSFMPFSWGDVFPTVGSFSRGRKRGARCAAPLWPTLPAPGSLAARSVTTT